jgi:ribosome-associated protein
LANKKITAVVIDALEDIKARDIKLINVTKLTSVFDYIAVASADSSRQTKALARNVMDKVRESGGWIYGTEGEASGEWVLVDCGDVVVHVMQPAVREHYKLEELWGEGKVEFPKPPRARSAARPAEEKPAKVAVKKRATNTRTPIAKTKTKGPVATKKKPATGKATTTRKRTTTDKVVVKTVTAKVRVAKTAKVKVAVAKKPVARKRKPATA